MSGTYKEASEKYKVERRKLADPEVPKHRKKRKEKGKYFIQCRVDKNSPWKKVTFQNSYGTIKAAKNALETIIRKRYPVIYEREYIKEGWWQAKPIYASEYRIVDINGLPVPEKDI